MIVNPRERGNILFLILLAVVLFAALSYAVTNSMRGGGNDSSGEKAVLRAGQVASYGAALEAAIQRLTLSNNCTHVTIDLDNDVVSGYNNTQAPTSGACDLFRPTGGGQYFWDIPDEMLDSVHSTMNGFGHLFFSNQFNVMGIGLSDGSNGSQDLAFAVPYVREDVCKSYNEKMIGSSTIPDGEVGYDPGSFGVCKWTGSHTWCSGNYNTGSVNLPIPTRSACVKVTAWGSMPTHYYIYYVLLAR